MLVNNGETPLTVASTYGHADVVKLLLAHSAINVDLGKSQHVTPLLKASMHGWVTVVQQLLDKLAQMAKDFVEMSVAASDTASSSSELGEPQAGSTKSRANRTAT